MFKNLIIILIITSFSLLGCKKNNPTEPDSNNTQKGWNLVWADEFNYTGLPDSTKWRFEVGGHGWGNNELQYYTDRRLSNARVENDNLVIEARKELWEGKDYTSTRLNSTGQGNWTYGRIEIKAKLPYGKGTWPALWMLASNWTYGDGGWPANGEIDIMEHVGYDYGWIHGSIHTTAYNHKIGTQKSGSIRFTDVATNYHIYAIEWDADTIDYYVDATKYFSFANEHKGYQYWPFDKDFHLIFNIAVGGDWGGAQGVDPTIFPQKMLIDYVRVYKFVE
ncbi:MAG TPA: glycoside hydrolase family 16 protein [Ignavibacteriaceae bacterium]|nr:glycoside hydrolase family 16 protein [Ignavibacteriaceae bacterium]